MRRDWGLDYNPCAVSHWYTHTLLNEQAGRPLRVSSWFIDARYTAHVPDYSISDNRTVYEWNGTNTQAQTSEYS